MPNQVETPDINGATTASAITKSDSTVVNCRAIYVGGTGDVAVKSLTTSAAVTFTAVPAGTILPVRAAIVMSTGTTATAMVALF